jgi:hypothetical protein
MRLRRTSEWRAWVVGAAIGVAWVVAGSTSTPAQWGYPYGYGGFGWGGWVSNPNASWMTGLGNFAKARGQQEVDLARARAINADTVMKWNKAMRERQRQLDAENARKQAQDAAANAEAAFQQSILDGSALNAVLDQILEFNAGGVKAFSADAPLSAEVLRDIPFEAQTEALTVCLDQMTGEDAWPRDLQAPELGTARAAVTRAVDAALAEDAKGEVSPQTAKAIASAVNALRDQYVKTADKETVAFAEADTFLRTLAGLSRMLNSARVQPVVRAIETYKQGDIGDLIGFMQAFNLRFGPARSDRQKAIYQQLYPMLVQVLTDTSGTTDRAAHAAKVQARDTTGQPLQQAAREAFQGMTWDHYAEHDRSAP